MDRLQSRHIRLIYVLVFFVILITKVSGIPEREPEVSCPSIDVRNTPKELEKIGNCTVIKGSLMIVLIQKSSASNFAKYSFPKLREITDFLLIDDVAGLTRLDTLFPNLTVIRGRRLFLNYALSIYALKDLEIVGLKSLIAIQRGHIFIDRCPKLCYLEKVNWDQITLSQGVNHIRSDGNSNHTCSNLCRSCANCWSSFDCQKFQDANLVNLLRKGKCHPQCLGGCFSNQTTPDNCLLCRNFSIDGKCVEECPKNRYSSKDHLRCYTAGECADLGFYIHQNECVPFCPSGYEYKGSTNDILRKCELCTDDCPRTCNGSNIHNLADSEFFGGCKIVNGSIIMRIPGKVNEDELKSNLQEIQEIKGYLKIYETPSMTSMEVFRDLVIIGGNRLAYRHFGLLIYGNKYLTKLWDFDKKKELQIHNSSIFMHSNYRLCNSYIKKLVDVANHNLVFDEIQYNDQEVSCDPITINIKVEVLSKDTVTLEWDMGNLTNAQIYYLEAPEKNGTLQFDQDKDHCERKLWLNEDVIKQDLDSNQTLARYNITSLKQNTQYVCFMRIFGGPEDRVEQSNFIFFTTKLDIPTSPIVFTQNKSADSIELTWFSVYKDRNEVITFYKVDIFVHPDREEVLDRRNYCTEPYRTVDAVSELIDYDRCCDAKEFESDEFEFIAIIDQKFRCSVDVPRSCNAVHSGIKNNRSDSNEIESPKIYNSKYYIQSINNISSNATAAVIAGLEHFTLYVFHFFACNDLGCAPYFLHSDRTAPDKDADRVENVDVSVTKKGKQYEFSVKIVPPKKPNGAVLQFTIYFRRGPEGSYIGDLKCLSRSDFQKMNYEYVKLFPYNDYKVSVRIQSLAGPGKSTEWVILYTPHLSQVSWLTWLLICLFTGFIGVILFAVRRRLGIGNQRSIPLISHPVRMLRRSQHEDEDEDILMESMQTMHVDEYNPLEGDDEDGL